MWKEHRVHERLRILHMYSVYVGMVMEEINGGLAGGWAALVRDVVIRLLVILDQR